MNNAASFNSVGNYHERRIRVAIHQPNFLPRLKVLQKLATADVWCVLDSVQYCAREWQNRARLVAITGDNGRCWLSVPVIRPLGRRTAISNVVVASPATMPRVIERTLRHCLRRAPYWGDLGGLLSVLESPGAAESLTRLCVESTCSLLSMADRQPTVLLASALQVTGKASTLMAAICRHLNATAYLADSGGRKYLRALDFTGIEVLWQNWREPPDEWPGIKSWKDVAGVNYLARVGREHFKLHLLGGEFICDRTWDLPAGARPRIGSSRDAI